MDDALRMLERWDAGEPVQVLRLTNGGPVQEHSAHLLAFELLRDGLGLPLPDSPGAWAGWGADAVARVQRTPGIDLPASSLTTAKAYAYNLLRGGWEALGSAAPAMNHILVSRTLPGLEPPVSPKTVAAAKEHDRLAAWILAELPDEIRGDTDDPSATGIAIRLLAEWKAQRGLAHMRKVVEAPPAPLPAELLQDAEDRLGDRLEEALAAALAPLVVRLNALEQGGNAKPARKLAAPPEEAAPVVLTPAGGKGPAVVEGKRPTGKTSFPETERSSGRQR